MEPYRWGRNHQKTYHVSALSDEFGRKPLILLPLVGFFTGYLLNTIHYTLLSSLPLEFFYTDNVAAFFGGMPIYYLGIYSYCISATLPNERAHRLARLDGVEAGGKIIGTILSPVVFKNFGYFGNYGLSLGTSTFAILYLIIIAKEPLAKKSKTCLTTFDPFGKVKKKSPIENLKIFLIAATVGPLRAMFRIFTCPRDTLLKVTILLLLFCYAIYSLAFQVDFHVRYLYMSLIFNPLHEQDYAYFMVAMNLVSAVCLIVLVPILTQRFGIDDALIGAVVLIVEITSCLVTPFIQVFWQFYLIQSFGAVGLCKFSLLRSLMSKCIQEDEVGKMFSLLAVIAALAPLVANPIFRQLYNHTLENFPGSVFHLAAGFLVLSVLVNVFIYLKQSNKHRPKIDAKQEIHTKPETTEIGNEFQTGN